MFTSICFDSVKSEHVGIFLFLSGLKLDADCSFITWSAACTKFYHYSVLMFMDYQGLSGIIRDKRTFLYRLNGDCHCLYLLDRRNFGNHISKMKKVFPINLWHKMWAAFWVLIFFRSLLFFNLKCGKIINIGFIGRSHRRV